MSPKKRETQQLSCSQKHLAFHLALAKTESGRAVCLLPEPTQHVNGTWFPKPDSGLFQAQLSAGAELYLQFRWSLLLACPECLKTG